MVLGCLPDLQISEEFTVETPKIMKIAIKKLILHL